VQLCETLIKNHPKIKIPIEWHSNFAQNSTTEIFFVKKYLVAKINDYSYFLITNS